MSSILLEAANLVNVHLYVVSILLRIALVAYSVLHDAVFRVKYTDIDYMIIVDGARFMLEGRCPFARTTYRYTPILAALVLPSVLLFDAFGKLLFSACDVAVLYLCDRLLSKTSTTARKQLLLKLFIAFNPVVLNVSTRGNSDMLMALFTLLALFCFDAQRYVVAAGILGFAAHFKIYPLIYVPPFVFGVWANLQPRRRRRTSLPIRPPKTTVRDRPEYFPFVQWVRVVIPSAASFLVSFLFPTVLCYYFCGQPYLNEAFLYHVVREDHRHNFSPYWLLMYLNMAGRAQQYGVEYAPGLLAFLPQVVVLLCASWRLRHNVAQACCVVTVLFIAFNKVCTVQYFVWFIPLLPFVFADVLPPEQGKGSDEEDASKAAASRAKHYYAPPSCWAMMFAFSAWCSTIPLWVVTTYPLEFLGENHFGRVWLASALFFLATAALGGWLGRVSSFYQLFVLKQSPPPVEPTIHLSSAPVALANKLPRPK